MNTNARLLKYLLAWQSHGREIVHRMYHRLQLYDHKSNGDVRGYMQLILEPWPHRVGQYKHDTVVRRCVVLKSRKTIPNSPCSTVLTP